MKNRIMTTYIAGSVIPPVIYALIMITGIITLNSFRLLSDSLQQVDVSLWQLLFILILGIPANLVLSSAVAVLFGLYIGLSNLSKNLEIVAFRSLGISITGLLIPAGIIGIILGVFIGFMSIYLTPLSLKKIEEIKLKLLQNSTEILIEPEELNRIGDYLIFAKKKEKGKYSGLVFTDWKDAEEKFIIVAEQGSFYFSIKKKILVLSFQKGKIYQYLKNTGDFEIISFESLNFPLEKNQDFLDYPTASFAGNAEIKDLLKRTVISLNFTELLKLMDYTKDKSDSRTFYKLRAEFFNRFNYALFPIAFSFIALASGIYHPRFPGKLVFVKLMVLIGVHYYLNGLFHKMSDVGVIHPALMFLLPLIWSILGILLFFLKNYDLASFKQLFGALYLYLKPRIFKND